MDWKEIVNAEAQRMRNDSGRKPMVDLRYPASSGLSASPLRLYVELLLLENQSGGNAGYCFTASTFCELPRPMTFNLIGLRPNLTASVRFETNMSTIRPLMRPPVSTTL